jgi:hypothetical protein
MLDGPPGSGEQVEQALDLGHGERDGREVGWWWLGAAGRCGLCLGVGPSVGGGDRADRQGSHDQHDVPHDRCEQAVLGLVEAELVLAEFMVFFDGPASSAHRDQDGEGGWDVVGNVAEEVRHLGRVIQAAANQQEVPRAGGGQPAKAYRRSPLEPGPQEAICQEWLVRIFRAASTRTFARDGSVTRNEQGTPRT